MPVDDPTCPPACLPAYTHSQVVTGLMVNPPKEGEPSYAKYNEVGR